jgi:hypothetical protein
MTEIDVPPFLRALVDRLAGLAGVTGVALGGSRASGRAGPDSDWDLGVYVGEGFTAAAVRTAVADAGWTGHVAERGEWGPVMDGGAWLDVGGQSVDLLWRDTVALGRLAAEAAEGHFRVVRIPFHLAGIPSYTPLGELAGNIPLRGSVPPGGPMPAALRTAAAGWWTENARFDRDYAVRLRGRDDPAVATALLVRAVVELGHARQCARGVWVLNEKGLLRAAGLDGLGRAVTLAGTGNDEGFAAVAEQVADAIDRS